MDDLFVWMTEIGGRASIIGSLVAGHHTPLMSASEDTARKLEPLAVEHGKALQQPVRLVRFSSPVVLVDHPRKSTH